jgi:hypothetical protein
MIVELLYFEACPHRRDALALINDVLLKQAAVAQVREIEVPDSDAARENKFLGSPTIRVNGKDIEPAARSMRRYGLMCRVYLHGNVTSGIPPRVMIEDALKNAQRAEGREHDG